MFATYLRRGLIGRLRQTALVSLGLAVGIGLVITIVGVSSGLEDAQTLVLESFYGVGTDVVVTRPPDTTWDTDNTPAGGSLVARGLGPIDAAAVDTMADAPGVATANGALALTDIQLSAMTPVTGSPGDLAPDGSGPRMVEATGVDPGTAPGGPLGSASLIAGRALDTADATADVALLDAGYAEQQDLTVGSTITLAGTPFEIVGIAAPDEHQDLSHTYIPLARAQALADLPDAVNTIYVIADSAADLAAVREEITALVPSAIVTTSSDVADQITGSLANTAELADSLGTWLAVAAMSAAFLAASVLTLSDVARRTRELGTLKALGWPSRRILGQLLAEAIAKGIVGALAGVALGYGAAALVSNLAPSLSASVGPLAGAAPSGAGTAAATGSVAVDLTAPITPISVAAAVALAIAGALGAGLAGSWRATRLEPAAAFAHAT